MQLHIIWCYTLYEVTSFKMLFLCLLSAGVAGVTPHEAGAGSVEGVTGGLDEAEEGGGVVENAIGRAEKQDADLDAWKQVSDPISKVFCHWRSSRWKSSLVSRPTL